MKQLINFIKRKIEQHRINKEIHTICLLNNQICIYSSPGINCNDNSVYKNCRTCPRWNHNVTRYIRPL